MSILRNPNVTITRIDGSLVEYCKAVGASLLVADPDLFTAGSELARLLEFVPDGTDLVCDVLIVRERSGAAP